MSEDPWSARFLVGSWCDLHYYAGCSFVESLTNSPPAPLEFLYLFHLLSHLLPQFVVADGVSEGEWRKLLWLSTLPVFMITVSYYLPPASEIGSLPSTVGAALLPSIVMSFPLMFSC
ncbi:anoctamin-3 isoform X1 [Tachysurus ichikawai]